MVTALLTALSAELGAYLCPAAEGNAIPGEHGRAREGCSGHRAGPQHLPAATELSEGSAEQPLGLPLCLVSHKIISGLEQNEDLGQNSCILESPKNMTAPLPASVSLPELPLPPGENSSVCYRNTPG